MPPADRERVAAGSNTAGIAARRNVQSAITRSRFLAVEDDWRKVAGPRVDLEKALSLLCLTSETPPALDVTATLDAYAEEIGEHLSGDRAFDVGLSILAEVLYRRHKLRGNNDDYYTPDNSYLDRVLATGKGIPISLCAIAILVARRLELPVAGVGSPGHFLGFYGDVHLRIGSFFDPNDGFRRLNAGELRALLAHFVDKVEPEMLNPVSDREIVSRFLRNLMGCYTKLDQPEQIRNLERWNRTLNP